MFCEEIELIKGTFINYFADGRYLVIFLIALLAIFIKENKKENKNILVYYTSLILILVCNPIFCYIISKFIENNIYYRVLWLLPIGIVIAYFCAQFISKIDSKFSKVVAIFAIMMIIAYSGKYVYSSQVFYEADNWYKLPGQYVEIVEVINELSLENKKAMVSTNVVEYIRQMDASINLAYGRRPQRDYQNNKMLQYYNSGDVKNLVELCNKNNVNIIVYDKQIPLTISPSHYGFDLYKQLEHYDIYVLQ